MDRKPVCLSQLTRSGGQNGLHFGGWLLLEYITDITGDFGFGTPEIDSIKHRFSKSQCPGFGAKLHHPKIWYC